MIGASRRNTLGEKIAWVERPDRKRRCRVHHERKEGESAEAHWFVNSKVVAEAMEIDGGEALRLSRQ